VGEGDNHNHESDGHKSIRILLVNNHEMIRTALRMLIESQDGMTIVGEAASPNEAVSVAGMKQPDIVLLDIHNGNQDGVDFIPGLHAAAADARVLVLADASDSDQHTRAMLSGAVGVLSKQETAGVLVKALQKVSIGEAWIDRATMASVLTELSRRNGSPVEIDQDAAKIATLTERELQVVALVCAGLKNKEIAERLFISESTVRHHLSSIFSKLGVSCRLDLIIYANRQGLVDLRMSGPPSDASR
jgi:DNA-binding NarL/FixJ family response regulator